MSQTQTDMTFIGMVAQEKMEVIINDKVTFDYNRSKHQEKIEEELNEDQLDLSCIPYEAYGELTTGYKIFHQDDQVATLEFRSGEWIGAVFPSGSLVTLKNVDREKVYAWIRLMVLGK